MVLPFLSRTPRRDLGPRVSPPTDSPPTDSQGGCGSGARVDAPSRKTKEVEHLLANLEKEGVEIDGKISSIIDDEAARIRAEAAREKNDPLRKGLLVLLTVSSVAFGFAMGAEWYAHAIYEEMIKRIIFGEK